MMLDMYKLFMDIRAVPLPQALFLYTNKTNIRSKNQECGHSTSLAEGGSLAITVVTSNLTSNLNVVPHVALNDYCRVIGILSIPCQYLELCSNYIIS